MIFKVLIIGLISLANAANIRPSIYADEKVQNYLTSFGYLPESDKEIANLRTDQQLREAIRDLQSFAGLPTTGEIDQATSKLMNSRRCGLPDKSDSQHHHSRHKRFAIHGSPWRHRNLTWSLRTERPGGLNTHEVRRELGSALNLWARNSKLTFREINSDRADILIYFQRHYHGDGYPFDGRGQILAHAFFPGPDRGGDAHFDEDEIWLLNNESTEDGTSLLAVAAHEFGHSLGLTHSSVRGALMYPYYQGISQNYELPDDDRNGIQQMYGAPEDKLWANIPKSHSTQPPRAMPTTTIPTPRRTHYPSTRWGHPKTSRPLPADDIPDKCDTSYDAITIIRREVYVFKGSYLWRKGDKGIYHGYPTKITGVFKFPHDIDHVDAVYQTVDERKIVFFIGKKYYVFNAGNLESGYPKPLKTLGLPETLEKIDGAFVWGYNNRTYFFSGTMYWRFDESSHEVEWDYPRDISMFKGVSYNIDTVFQWKNGKTYFFKGKGYWEFDDLRMRVAHKTPKLSAPFWMDCPSPGIETNDIDYSPRKAKITLNSSSQNSMKFSIIIISFLITIFIKKT
ncbi:hypothetical protein HCN44_007295 [Aphidius gifuensis]|uniref:Peptidase metallopeptidase domain-containing protein n=1 Tax=Aphidius gifuensis TaxID=684658 RepID=A0A835CQA9_APHGI|nr:matrix metalloproteinase-2 [Aphidius gifuensis]XP_044015075.1 matrix metalloproteinase-2 [Aphidius gifuensis]XP_044015076.1 matrix metalloproteinase-2 [Aphidius gifuensis]XP_044015077.1 matrix metalloproteinase-2 [Aphidius gifuensis]XP_044015078.1 matrix metalloproteinase-2 [Aphidius gifuensis]XP_044015079.1 matrix metalloproteinase-2 [Aphidius gifuensis]KAF7988985.1 hypothetical protein HCN44_007295 [Aphidius gifuensis]